MIGTGALAAAGVLFRRRFPLWLLAAATLDGVVGGEVSASVPFAASAVTRYGRAAGSAGSRGRTPAWSASRRGASPPAPRRSIDILKATTS